MKRLVWLLVLPLTPLFVIFVVANRHIVTLSLDPTPIIIDAPLYSIVLTSAFIGILVGGFIAWLQGLRWRSQLRNKQQAAHRHEIELLQTAKAADKYEHSGTKVIKTA